MDQCTFSSRVESGRIKACDGERVQPVYAVLTFSHANFSPCATYADSRLPWPYEKSRLRHGFALPASASLLTFTLSPNSSPYAT